MQISRLSVLVTAIAAVALFAGACSSDDDDESTVEAGTTAATAAATEAATTEATAAPTEAATTEGPMPFGLSTEDVDGLICTGTWNNETFGSSGAFAATFEVGGEGGQVTLELGGNVFGGAGGTVEVPYALDGDAVVVSADLGLLGVAELRLDGSANEGTFAGPPALGGGASVSIADFAFDATQLSTTVDIDFGTGAAPARSTVSAECARP